MKRWRLTTSNWPPTLPTPAKTKAAAAGLKLPTGRRTPDRDAIDAVAMGAFDEAAQRYASLATAHPDSTAYKDAARILADKVGRAH